MMKLCFKEIAKVHAHSSQLISENKGKVKLKLKFQILIKLIIFLSFEDDFECKKISIILG